MRHIVSVPVNKLLDFAAIMQGLPCSQYRDPMTLDGYVYFYIEYRTSDIADMLWDSGYHVSEA